MSPPHFLQLCLEGESIRKNTMSKNFWKAIFIITMFSISVLSSFAQINDFNEQLQPEIMVPANQNGYGDGPRQLAQPDDIEFLRDGTLLVSDCFNNRLQHYDSNGELIKSISASDLGLEGIATPTGISQDDEGYIYVSMEDAGTVVRLNSDLTINQRIGSPSEISADDYYKDGNEFNFIKPQGLISTSNGDIIAVDMDKKKFRKNGVRRFGLRKFNKIENNGVVTYEYDKAFAESQQITTVMHKSEGMAICEERNIIFFAEEKPVADEHGNSEKYRFVAGFDLTTGKYLDRLYGVKMENGLITKGYIADSIEGIAVYKNWLFMVDEKGGQVWVFDIETGDLAGRWGKPAHYYCDDESNKVINGIDYNEQTIMTGGAMPHLLNSWQNNELASPDGINISTYSEGAKKLGVVDQWNSRILIYDLEKVLELLVN